MDLGLFDYIRGKTRGAFYKAQNAFYGITNRIHPDFYWKEEIQGSIFPLGYCFPDENFVETVPLKNNLWAEVIPGLNETYRFNTESSYFEMYQDAKFGFTWKKGGWDCLRHYEILANGCIPVFRDLADCPEATLSHFPKELLLEAKNELLPWNPSESSEQKFQDYATRLLEFSRANLTCSAAAKRFLGYCNLPENAKVLMLNCDPRPNYSRELLQIGLNRVLKKGGGKSVSYPLLDFLYEDFPEDMAKKQYGRGFGYTRRLHRELPEEIHPLSEEVLKDQILSKQWDFILYGKVGLDEFEKGSIPNVPFWKEVSGNYSKDEIGFLYGGDGMQDLTKMESPRTRHLRFHAKYGKCFVRELKIK